MNVLIFVPARGGSKSIPKKNLADLAGSSLIHWCLESATDTGWPIVVSTDDRNITIAVESRWPGIRVAKRPEKLSGDDVPVAQVVIDYLDHNPAEYHPDIIVLVQPTSPFVSVDDIRSVVNTLDVTGPFNSAQTVCRVSHNDHLMNQRLLHMTGLVDWAAPAARKFITSNKQSKPELWKFGNVVAVRTNALLKQGEIFAQSSAGIPITKLRCIDIDDITDLDIAEAIVKTGLL